MVVALQPLHKATRIKRVVVDTYQAASGAGKAAMDELIDHSRRTMAGDASRVRRTIRSSSPSTSSRHRQLPRTTATQGRVEDAGRDAEDHDLPDLRLSATCVRVPVAVGHSEALHVEFERPMSPDEARAILSNAPGIEVVDDPLDARVSAAARRGRARPGLCRPDSGGRLAPGRHRALGGGRQPAQGCRAERGPDRRALYGAARWPCGSASGTAATAATRAGCQLPAQLTCGGLDDRLWTRTHRDGHPVRRARARSTTERARSLPRR